MRNVWFISDTHFGHANIITFTYSEGRLRPFTSVEEMDETIIERWNAVVKSSDRVYHLGDVAMAKKSIATVGRCNGRKVLLRGNHDIFKLKDYTPYFEDVRAYKIYPAHGLICSHIPVHPCQFGGRFRLNVHGHTHAGFVRDNLHVMPHPDPRYINVSVERTNYTPVNLDEILERAQRGLVAELVDATGLNPVTS